MAHSLSTDMEFPNVRSEGQLLPLDILRRVLARDKELGGLADRDCHVDESDSLGAAVNRSWQIMRGCWSSFDKKRAALPETDTGTSLTRDALLLPLFRELGYGWLSQARPEQRQVTLPDGTQASYAISHFRDNAPVHLVGCHVSLDRRTSGVRGAARQSPHSLTQEFLNRSDPHLWGFVSNGLKLRLLRDCASLSRQAYVEWDLEAVFSAESFPEFALLWLVCHQSRIEPDSSDGRPESCLLEQWCQQARMAEVAALDNLSLCVREAVQLLGQGFLNASPELRRKLADRTLTPQDYFRELLRLVYRLIFLFVVEERGLLHAPAADQATRDRYARSWSMKRLRDLSALTAGTRHYDLWEGVKLVMRALESTGCQKLGLEPMGGFLWSAGALPDLEGLTLANRDLLAALRKLAFTRFGQERRPVDWRHLGAMELGSVYESLLELHPQLEDRAFTLKGAQGSERKTSGSYYTPAQLIESLLATALDPVLEEAVRGAPSTAEQEARLLDLTICDPACGSGHFLLAAAQRLAKKLASVRTGDSEPSPEALRAALRDVAGRCLYGIDVNPMAVELCKVGLWLETHEAGRPLTFVDHHFLCANTLMGTTAQAIQKGIPDEAYTALEGDDKKACAALRKTNKLHSDTKTGKLDLAPYERAVAALRDTVREPSFDADASDTVTAMQAREQAWKAWLSSDARKKAKTLYDLWTAAFVLRRAYPVKQVLLDGTKVYDTSRPFGVTWKTLLDFVETGTLPADLASAVEKTAQDYHFFHPEIAFPEVRAKGGFDCLVGNPPWERIKIQEKEWFTAHQRAGIANARTAAQRKKMIAQLQKEDPGLLERYAEDQRQAAGFSQYLHVSALYPLCGRGDINLYAVFAEWMRRHLNKKGRLGCIVPSGIASDNTTKDFFSDLIATRSLISLYDFENKELFPAVHSQFKFCLLTAGSGEEALAERPDFVFFAHTAEDLKEKERHFSLTAREIALVNPNTRTCPIFRGAKDAELTKAVFRRVPVLLREAADGSSEVNPWGLRFGTMFHMANDSSLFRSQEQLEDDGWDLDGNVFARQGKDGSQERALPLYEAKMAHQFTHRWATYEGEKTRNVLPCELKDPGFAVLPRHWVLESDVTRRLAGWQWQHDWLMGWRDICRATDERTVISAVLPKAGVGHTMPLFFTEEKLALLLIACLNSFIADYICRQKMAGTHLSLNYSKQIAVLPPSRFDKPCPWSPDQSLAQWLTPRALELLYTAEDLRPFAMDMGYEGSPFPWDEERRFALRCELDAVFFHLYLPCDSSGRWIRAEGESAEDLGRLAACFATPRDAAAYIMDTFPILQRKDEESSGSFRTKDAILAAYDRLLDGLRQPAAPGYGQGPGSALPHWP